MPGRHLPATHGRWLAGQILARARSSGLAPGSRLPTERQLAVDLGVTRSAVRHALAVLQADGMISREVGRGTFLLDRGGLAGSGGQILPGLHAAADGTGSPAGPTDFAPADVMAVRRLLEPQAMPLVVAWARARDFEEMDRCLSGGDSAADYAEFETWDLALHRCIISASNSRLLVRLYEVIEVARHGQVWGDLKRRSTSPERCQEYQLDHRAIVAALRARDKDEAVAAMRTHLARVSGHLLGNG
jgi:DNA-binding FadR family transcriptional regulator